MQGYEGPPKYTGEQRPLAFASPVQTICLFQLSFVQTMNDDALAKERKLGECGVGAIKD